ncbi:hypothetical protein F3Y22_tig00110962pilonHSYRG00105 [Hibiscus syriacus]|uniref:Uncharacterized protein n=1 Tax=Hibiscus syriacus TaxID=106335 RepID=A0A6A2Z9H6_HIBSY|nr:hypothetical protein F3Y22_tig00110962pilonHSYRG00105 [Hibiscus syriacus]
MARTSLHHKPTSIRTCGKRSSRSSSKLPSRRCHSAGVSPGTFLTAGEVKVELEASCYRCCYINNLQGVELLHKHSRNMCGLLVLHTVVIHGGGWRCCFWKLNSFYRGNGNTQSSLWYYCHGPQSTMQALQPSFLRVMVPSFPLSPPPSYVTKTLRGHRKVELELWDLLASVEKLDRAGVDVRSEGVEKINEVRKQVLQKLHNGIRDQWKDLEWNDRAIHVSAANQTKWWPCSAKDERQRFSHSILLRTSTKTGRHLHGLAREVEAVRQGIRPVTDDDRRLVNLF